MWNNRAEGSQHVEYMDTSQAPCWCWYYLADCGRWHRFEDDPDISLSTDDIERCYLKDSMGVLQTCSSTGGSKIDFSAMLQTDCTTGRQRRIQRSCHVQIRCSCFSSVPVFWEMVDPKLPYQLIRLNEFTPEYQTVADFVKNDGLLDRTIVSISRIQNLDLWELYCRKKKQLMRIQGVKEINERRIFHGTQISNVHNICTYNFDFRLPSANGHVFGKGTYFARHASYADNYSKWSTDPLPLYGGASQAAQGQQSKIIFLARVMIGKSKMGHKEFQKPDHETSTNNHDSCVDNIKDPKIFVIFDPNQIYPEYLIQYC
ncbi:protein mono-ADP-ribosyltransferase PARP11-like isoform X1 [Centroberyx affinis]|uniref:protein mono-ADP-ribosyltransferase PARP11-like isoform X1 n=1 Tax=Centroberyx affinis TaxID=166261 RepID=UPI003A5C0F41